MPNVAAAAARATTVAIRMVRRLPCISPRGGRPRIAPLYRLCAERGLCDLAQRVARECIEVAHLAWALVRRQEARDVIRELALPRLGEAVLDDHPRDDPLAE